MAGCIFRVVTPPETRRRPRPRRIFPFRFAGQSIGAITRCRDQPTYLVIQPGNIGSCILPTDAHHRVAIGLMKAGILPTRACTLARIRVAVVIASIPSGMFSLPDEGRVFASRYIVPTQSERSQRNNMLRRFIRNRFQSSPLTYRPGFFRCRRTHGEITCWDHYHLRAIGAVAEQGTRRALRSW